MPKLRFALLVTTCYLASAGVAAAGSGLRPVQAVPLPRASGVVASPDGRTVYVRSGVGSLGSLAVFARDGATGKLTQIQCLARRVRSCTDGRGLETPSAIAIPRDGTNVYVAAANGQSVGVYRRAPSGRLTFAGSVTGLAHPLAVAVSPDGATVYVGGDRIWVFDRQRGGGLALRRTIDAPARALAAAGSTVYAAADGAIVAYSPDGDELDRVEATLRQPSQMVVAHGFVYVVSLGRVSRWTLALEPAGATGALPLAFGLAVTDRVYAAYRDGIAVFSLDLGRAGTPVRLAHAVGVAGAGRHVYAVARAGLSAFAR